MAILGSATFQSLHGLSKQRLLMEYKIGIFLDIHNTETHYQYGCMYVTMTPTF